MKITKTMALALTVSMLAAALPPSAAAPGAAISGRSTSATWSAGAAATGFTNTTMAAGAGGGSSRRSACGTGMPTAGLSLSGSVCAAGRGVAAGHRAGRTAARAVLVLLRISQDLLPLRSIVSGGLAAGAGHSAGRSGAVNGAWQRGREIGQMVFGRTAEPRLNHNVQAAEQRNARTLTYIP